MCLILIAFQKHPLYKFIVAANRDEFYHRPTQPAAWWKDTPFLLAGKDLKHGGTWLGITKAGKFAAISNFRDPKNEKKNAVSRGSIVTNYLKGEMTAEEYLLQLKDRDAAYNGFNLVLGNQNHLWYYSNQHRKSLSLAPGIYGLSNHFIDEPWTKVTRGKKALSEAMNQPSNRLNEYIFSFLQDSKMAADNELPDTGIGTDWEKLLSPIFIRTPVYGTRSSTVLLIDTQNQVTFIERGFIPEGENRFSFQIKSQVPTSSPLTPYSKI